MLKMKKCLTALMVLTFLVSILAPLSSMAVFEESEYTLIYFADGDNLPGSSNLLKDGGITVAPSKANGAMGKEENDSSIKVTMSKGTSGTNMGSFINVDSGIGLPSTGYIICEADFCTTNGFKALSLKSDSNGSISNEITNLSPGTWYNVAFVMTCGANGKESTQAYVNGVPYGLPRVNGTYGDTKSNGTVADDLRFHVLMEYGTTREYYLDNLRYYHTDSHSFGKDLTESFSDQTLNNYSLGNACDTRYPIYNGKSGVTGIGVATHGAIGGKASDDYALKLNYGARDCINVITTWDNAKNSEYIGKFNAGYDIYLDPDYTKYENLGSLVLTSNQGAVVSDDKVTGAYLKSLGEENPWKEGEWNNVSFVIECKANGDKSDVYTYINGVQVGSKTDSSTLNGNRSDIRFSIRSTQAVAPLSKTVWNAKTTEEKLAYAGKTTVVNASGDNYIFEYPIVCYLDNIHTYESKGNELYRWNGGYEGIATPNGGRIYPENAVGGKKTGDISCRLIDKSSTVAHIDYLWGDTMTGCADETDAIAKWTKGNFEGYLVVEFNLLNNGKFNDFSLRTNSSAMVSNKIEANKLKSGWNKITVVIENKASEDGKIVRTAREYVNGIEIIPQEDTTVVLGSYNSGSKTCNNTLRLNFTGSGSNLLDVYFDDLRIYETVYEPVLEVAVIPSNGNGIICDNNNRMLYVADFTEKTVADVSALVPGSEMVRIYEKTNMKAQLNSGDVLTEGQVFVVEDIHNTYAMYTVAKMPENEIIVTGENYNNSDKSANGMINICALAVKGSVLAIAKCDSATALVHSVKIVDEADVDGVLSVAYDPALAAGDTVRVILLESINTLKPLCEKTEFEYIQ